MRHTHVGRQARKHNNITLAVISIEPYLTDKCEHTALQQKCTHKTSKIKHIMHSRVRTHARTHAHTHIHARAHTYTETWRHTHTLAQHYMTLNIHTHARTERM